MIKAKHPGNLGRPGYLLIGYVYLYVTHISLARINLQQQQYKVLERIYKTKLIIQRAAEHYTNALIMLCESGAVWIT